MCTLNSRRQNAPSNARERIFTHLVVALFLGAISLTGAPQLRAQSEDSQQSSQDVAEAARQERARKQQRRDPNHVYTNEDLRRAKILSPEDQSHATVNRAQPVAPQTHPDAEPLDANSSTPQEPLGDVARRYRNARKISPFHLPANEPALAAPRILTPIPEFKPRPLAQPQPPARNFALVKPSAPVSRASVPSAPFLRGPRAHRIDPFAPRRIAPPAFSAAQPKTWDVPHIAVQPTRPENRPRAVSHENLPTTQHATLSTTGRSSALSIMVRPGDTLWMLSREHLGRGARWVELLAANPAITGPARLMPGTSLALPAKVAGARHVVTSVTVQPRDSLSKIARVAYGHGSYWPCIARANPTLTDPNFLVIGRTLVLPASCGSDP